MFNNQYEKQCRIAYCEVVNHCYQLKKKQVTNTNFEALHSLQTFIIFIVCVLEFLLSFRQLKQSNLSYVLRYDTFLAFLKV